MDGGQFILLYDWGGDPPEPEELIKALQELENSASSDATVREKIAKLPPAVSEQAKLSTITTSQEAEVLGVQVGNVVGFFI